MLYLYLLIEALMYSFMIYSAIFICKNEVVHFSRFMPIAFNFFFSLTQNIEWKIRIGLLLSVCADLCFLFLKNLNIGIAFYLMVQLHYYIYLNDFIPDKLYVLVVFNMIWSLAIKKEKTLGVISYAILSLVNVIKVTKKAVKQGSLRLFGLGIKLLAFCDSCIVLKMLFKKHKILNKLFDILEWGTYMPSQIAVVLFGINMKKRHTLYA